MPAPVILVTGSTDGIGKAMVRKLADSDAEIIIHGKDSVKGRETIREIKGLSWNRNIDLIIADFSIQEEVRRMAEEIRTRYNRLSVLVNNAGTYEKTALLLLIPSSGRLQSTTLPHSSSHTNSSRS